MATRIEILAESPYSAGEESLFLAYYASAEFGCHLALGWPMPENCLDLFTEFRCLTNGLPRPMGNNLPGALNYYGLDSIDLMTKEFMRGLVMRGGPWSGQEQVDILRYCESDVQSLERLFTRMESNIDLPRALIRGRYMKAAARMEWNGVPLDVEAKLILESHWTDIQDRLIQQIDKESRIYEGRTFKHDRFAAFLARNHVPWPRLDSGRLDLTDDTFKDVRKHTRK